MPPKTILITGANSGIGYAAASELLHQGHRLLLLCRTIEKAEDSKAKLLQAHPGEIHCYAADFSSLSSVRCAADQILEAESHIDVLINNAGLFSSTSQHSEDGHELTLAVNHLAPMLLTLVLLPLLISARPMPSRIVNVASAAHRRGKFNFDDPMLERRYSSGQAYCQSKLANILFSLSLDQRLGDECTVNSLHPGVVATQFASGEQGSYGFFFRFFRRWMKRPDQGAETVVFLATSETVEGCSGGYYKNCKSIKPSAHARSHKDAERLWAWSLEVLQPHLSGVVVP